MNMLQMLGGVAVAGAVAAGTTAFTAAGMALPAGHTVIGGAVDIDSSNLDGLALSSVVAVWDPATAKLTGMTVTFTTTPPVGTAVGVSVRDAAGAPGLHAFTCPAITTASTACTITGFVPATISDIYVSA